MFQKYKIHYADSFKEDIGDFVRYAIITFKYDGYKTIFGEKVKKATNKIKDSAKSLGTTDFLYRNKTIYMRCIEDYLYFYIIDGKKIIFLRLFRNGQDWKSLIALWIKKNGY